MNRTSEVNVPLLGGVIVASIALVISPARAVPTSIGLSTWSHHGAPPPLGPVNGTHTFGTQNQSMGPAGTTITVSSGPSLRPNWQYELSVNYSSYTFFGHIAVLELAITQPNAPDAITGFQTKTAAGAPFPGATGSIINGGGTLHLDIDAFSLLANPVFIVQWNQLEPRCEGDVNSSGAVEVNDLLAVITAWGACPQPCPPSCAPDVAPAAGDCTVNVNDMLAVITNWGPCR